jgi:hypothetical protein
VTVGPHAQAYLTLLAAATPALAVYDGAVPSSPSTPAPPYVVCYFTVTTPDDPAGTDLEEVPTWVDATAWIHSVGANGSAARFVAGRVRAVLLGAAPTVAGRDCGRIRHVDGQPPQRDESTGRLVFDQTDIYQFRSLPG